MRIPPPPPGFVDLDAAGVEGFARAEIVDVVRTELARHGTLDAASRSWSDPLRLSGRGELVAARPHPAADGGEGGGRWVVRPYLRGGLMSPLLRDRHLALGRPRPWVEARAAAALEAAGVPTAPVLAGLVYPGWPWYRAELVTAWLPGTRDLSALLFGDRRIVDAARRRALLVAAAGMPAALGAAGVLHRDLNAKNLLVKGTDGRFRMHVIDLDRARVGDVSSDEVGAMASRLARSLGKFESRAGPPLTPEEWAAFRTRPPADAPPDARP